MNWDLIVVSIFISLMPKDIEYFYYYFIFERGSCVAQAELNVDVAKDDLELFLFPLRKFWDYRNVPPHPTMLNTL